MLRAYSSPFLGLSPPLHNVEPPLLPFNHLEPPPSKNRYWYGRWYPRRHRWCDVKDNFESKSCRKKPQNFSINSFKTPKASLLRLVYIYSNKLKLVVRIKTVVFVKMVPSATNCLVSGSLRYAQNKNTCAKQKSIEEIYKNEQNDTLFNFNFSYFPPCSEIGYAQRLKQTRCKNPLNQE